MSSGRYFNYKLEVKNNALKMVAVGYRRWFTKGSNGKALPGKNYCTVPLSVIYFFFRYVKIGMRVT